MFTFCALCYVVFFAAFCVVVGGQYLAKKLHHMRLLLQIGRKFMYLTSLRGQQTVILVEIEYVLTQIAQLVGKLRDSGYE